MENTIFSIFKYTASEPKLLQKNIKWGEVTEYLDYNQNNPDMKVLQDDLEFSAVQNVIDYSQSQVNQIDKIFDVFEVGYEIDAIDNDLTQEEDMNNVINSYLISPQFPFPLSGILYNPAHITEPFKESEFQLVSFVLSDVMIEEEIEPYIIVEEENIISTDEIIVEERVNENVIDVIIEEPIAEEITIEEEIIEPIIIEPVEEITEEIINNEQTIDPESSSDKSILPVFLLAIVIGGIFVYYKKFRNSSVNSNSQSFVNNTKPVFSKIIHFDNKVTISIMQRG